ncbi:class I SAM-dependent methyltransferase [Luteimonas cucumeris]|uniref:class I SAM-dependent methyltransferase n=1 Tax=Luteimonas cucumeris TaxID=985012 RepID=UPI001A7EC295|nr:class I SAM-dependent methyltransferase [Luteimonas cucumeris]
MAGTPLHPQWLMPRRRVHESIRMADGVVLDIGAANRWVERELGQRADYIALDYPATASELYGTVPDVFGDAATLPFADKSVAAITCYEVLEHVREPDVVIAEISRILVAGGVAEFTMPFLYPVHDAPYDYQRLTEYGWSRSVEKAGLELVAIEHLGHSTHAASVLLCLALSGSLQMASPIGFAWRLPLAAVLIPFINLAGWMLAWIWPTWKAMALGHRVLVRKPG